MKGNFVRLATAAAIAAVAIIAAKAFPLTQQSAQKLQGDPITFSAGGPDRLAALTGMLRLTANQQEQACKRGKPIWSSR